MTEEEWWTSADPGSMLKQARFRSHKRKSRLFAVACCRSVWHLFVDERSRKAVEVGERFADGGATEEELRAAFHGAEEAHREIFEVVGKVGSAIEWAAAYAAHPNPFHAAKNVCWMAASPRCYEVRTPRPDDWDELRLVPCIITQTRGPLSFLRGKWQVTSLQEFAATGGGNKVQARLVHDIFGNPFRPWPTIDPAWLRWNDGTVPRLARSIYDQRSWLDMGILHDALLDAGCDDPDILDHCMAPGPHVRGCWVLDLLLGKD